MKKVYALLLTLAIIFSLAACTGNTKIDYTSGKESIQPNITESQTSSNDETVPPATDPFTEEVVTTTEAAAQETQKSETLSADFKAAMDSYEEFMDKYIAFMEKYNANPTDFTLLADYAKFMSDYVKFVNDFAKWEDEELNSAELAYYIDVQARVNKKLLAITQ